MPKTPAELIAEAPSPAHEAALILLEALLRQRAHGQIAVAAAAALAMQTRLDGNLPPRDDPAWDPYRAAIAHRGPDEAAVLAALEAYEEAMRA